MRREEIKGRIDEGGKRSVQVRDDMTKENRKEGGRLYGEENGEDGSKGKARKY